MLTEKRATLTWSVMLDDDRVIVTCFVMLCDDWDTMTYWVRRELHVTWEMGYSNMVLCKLKYVSPTDYTATGQYRTPVSSPRWKLLSTFHKGAPWRNHTGCRLARIHLVQCFPGLFGVPPPFLPGRILNSPSPLPHVLLVQWPIKLWCAFHN